MDTFTNDPNQLALDELADVGVLCIGDDGQCPVHVWVELGANVLALKAQGRTTLCNAAERTELFMLAGMEISRKRQVMMCLPRQQQVARPATTYRGTAHCSDEHLGVRIPLQRRERIPTGGMHGSQASTVHSELRQLAHG